MSLQRRSHHDRAAAEAAQVDAVLDAERAAHTALGETTRPAYTDAPWWLSDPALRDRFRH